MTPGQQTVIEQAIARGETLDQIVDTLNVATTVVDEVLRRMDAAIADDDTASDWRFRGERGYAGRPLAEHGTHAAFARHRYRGEQPCNPCVLGEASYQRAKHERRKAAA